MRTAAGVCVVALLSLLSCDPPPTGNDGGPANPPQVFLTVAEPNVIGDAISGKVNVSGCKKVAGVEIFHETTRLLSIENYTKSPTDFTLPSGTFANLYSQLGIAAALTLKAKVTCDDGRTNTSQPVGVTFFPIAQRLKSADGSQIVPDQFVAEGGFGGNPTTFIGCALTDQGTTIVRVDSSGALLALVNPAAMPFPCSLNTVITELTTVLGNYRWVFEPGAGAFALEMGSFSVHKKLVNSKAQRIGVGSKGTAAIWINEASTQNRIVKLSPTTSTSNDWSTPVASNIGSFPAGGIVNADPLVDEGLGSSVWVMAWIFNMGAGNRYADFVPYQYDLNTGALRNAVVNNEPAPIMRQQYPLNELSEPIIPQGFFTANGSTFVFPSYLTDTQQITNTVILSCSTGPTLCEVGGGRRWATRNLPGMLRMVTPFSNGNRYAVVGPFSVYFLDAQTGAIINLGEQPLRPSGSQMVVGVQSGSDADFYVLAGPNLGSNPSFATEIIAVDSPQSGELWRLNWGSGETPGNAMHIGVDSGGQSWLRVGNDLIKPLTLSQYRTARGATPLP
ncbi:MAG: hypothetical protein ACOZQL_37005 [Myxococcota bacterium]